MSDDDQQLVDEISHAPGPSTERSNEMDEMDEWVVDIEGRAEDPDISHGPRQSMDSDSSDSEEVPSIFGKWECWDDFGASFMPERKKWQLVTCLTHWFGLNVKLYLKYMQGKVDRAWSYYDGVDEQFRAKNSKNFIEHLLASSCFLIFAMFFLQYHEDYEKVIEDKMNDRNSFPKGLTRKDYGNLLTILQDRPKNQFYMLSMKYQIPWFVLEAVYTKLSNIGKVLDIPIHKLALPCFPKYVKVHPSKVDGVTVPEHGFKHLLHIFHWSRSPSLDDFLGYSTKLVGHFHIPSATDLILSQTDFVNDEGGSIVVSYSDNRRLSGSVMQLTPFRFSQFNTKLYVDLLIFERKYIHCGMPFTIYVACLTCLVKTEADARVLRENGVIPSTAFDDKEVLRGVQELKTFIADTTMPHELVVLEEEVMAHYQRSAYKVYGEFKKRYCSNPWIIISVIAGILLFLLTFLQTLYGMLSYYNQ